MNTSDATLIAALRILARDIVSDDGVANACITEAADRLEELNANMITIPDCIGVVAMMGDTAATHGKRTIGIRRQTIQVMG